MAHEYEYEHPNGSVRTWATPSGDKINIAPDQEERLRAKGIWPRNARGEEYCQVFYGLHHGHLLLDHEVGL